MGMNPYDIYEQAEEPRRLIDLGSMITSPSVVAADLFAGFVAVPMLTGAKGLMGLMKGSGPDGMGLSRFRAMTTAKYGRLSNANLRAMATHIGPRDLGVKLTSGSTYARDVEFARHLESNFGRAAATRMQIAKGLTGLSRGMLAYFAIDMGVSAVRGIVDIISDYQRPERQQKSRTLETGGLFVDTRSAQTQRMRAIQAIHNTQLSTRAAMGNEAAFMHLER